MLVLKKFAPQCCDVTKLDCTCWVISKTKQHQNFIRLKTTSPWKYKTVLDSLKFNSKPTNLSNGLLRIFLQLMVITGKVTITQHNFKAD